MIEITFKDGSKHEFTMTEAEDVALSHGVMIEKFEVIGDRDEDLKFCGKTWGKNDLD